MKRLALAALFAIMTVCGYAQNSSEVEETVRNIVHKYEGAGGVNCMSVVKGQGLEFIKMMLKKEFGKSFMKGVTSITIINYTDAPEDVCMAIRNDLDVFLSLLDEFDLGDEKQFSDNDYIRCFAAEDSGKLSDFVVAIENKESKTVMYMAGEILVED